MSPATPPRARRITLEREPARAEDRHRSPLGHPIDELTTTPPSAAAATGAAVPATDASRRNGRRAAPQPRRRW